MPDTGRKQIIFVMLAAALLPAIGFCVVDAVVYMQSVSVTFSEALLSAASPAEWIRRVLVCVGCFIIGPLVIKQDVALHRFRREQKYLLSIMNNMQSIFPEPLVLISKSLLEVKMTSYQAIQLGFVPESPPSGVESILEHVYPDDILALRTAVNRALNEGLASHVEFRCRGLEGWNSICWRIGTLNEHGVIPVVMFPIPETSLYRKLLMQKDEFLNQAEELSKSCVWAYDFAAENFTSFGKYGDILGLSADVVPASRGDLLEKLSKTDKTNAEAAWHKTLAAHDSVEVDYSVILNNGKKVWLRENLIIQRHAANGNPLKACGIIRDITQEHELIIKHKNAAMEFRRILDGTPQAIFVFAKNSLEIFSVNHTACEMFGYSQKDIMRQSRSSLHPDSEIERLRSIFSMNATSFDGTVGRVQCLKRNGESFEAWLDLKLIKNNHGNCIVASYKTSGLDEESSKSQKMLEEAVENSDFNIIICRPDNFSFEYFSRAACQALEYSPEAMAELTLPEIDSNLTLDICRNLWKELRIKRTITFESLSRTKFGKSFPIEIAAFYLKSEDEEYFCIVIRDISERKKSEEMVLAAKEQAESSSQVKTQFVANISHAIRTPLNGIMGFAELLRMPGESQAKMQEYADIILQCGHNLQEMIENLMDISKIESGEVTFNKREFSVNAMMDELYSFFQNLAKNSTKDIKIVMRKSLRDHECMINSDEQRIRQILTKLLNNAYKFTDQGIIEFGYFEKSPWLEFFVRDTGVGMDDEKIKSVFEPFREGDNQKFRKYGGNRLGLAVAKKLVNLMGGDIRCQSDVGAGCAFLFTLPFKRKTATEQVEVIDAPVVEKKGELDWSNKKILVVEDDPVNYLFIEKILEPTKVNLIHTEMAMPGIAACREDAEIDLVLMDIRLPDLSGWDATREIKKFRPNLPVIAQTANAMLEDKQRSFAAGCDDYLTKPLPKDALLGAINRFFNA
jgi:PAS domain S-box-containing protein